MANPWYVVLIDPSAANDISTLSCATSITDVASLTSMTISDHSTAAGSLFPLLSFGAGNLEQRCVAYGFRVTHTGPPLATSGSAIYYQTPSAGVLASSTTIASLRNHANTKIVPAHKLQDGKQFTWYLDDPKDLSTYQAGANVGGHSGSYSGGLKQAGAILAMPRDGNGNVSFNIELIAHWEVVGRTVTLSGTPTFSDTPVVDHLQSGYASAMRAAGNYVLNSRQLRSAAIKAASAAADSQIPGAGVALELMLGPGGPMLDY
jgi:hypothetical protein